MHIFFKNVQKLSKLLYIVNISSYREEQLKLRVLKVFDLFYVAVWKFYYKLMHNNLSAYFSAWTPTLTTVCSRYDIRAPNL